MIIEYHRPESLDRAIALLQRHTPRTLPLGGGSILTQPSSTDFAVVDLQELGLDTIVDRGNFLELGATVTLQKLLDSPGPKFGLDTVFRLEASNNLRQVATIAGTLVGSTGRSPLTVAFLALDATLTVYPDPELVALGDLLPIRESGLAGRLITQVTIPTNVKLSYQYVARTPADLPLVCAAVVRWPAGRTRVALGGFGPAAILAFDGPSGEGAEVAARDAYSHAGDAWASAEYRQEMADILTRRGLSATGGAS